MERFAKLAALGAYGVGAGTIALFALIAWVSRPTPTGGIDATSAILTWISGAVPAIAIVVVHIVYARILLRYANRAR
jgi:hypothetical protein